MLSHSTFHSPPYNRSKEKKKKDGERSKGKGRRVCLGDRIYSVPCRASCFALVDLEEKVEFILFFHIDRGKIASAAGN